MECRSLKCADVMLTEGSVVVLERYMTVHNFVVFKFDLLTFQKKKEREGAILKKNSYMSSEESGDDDSMIIHPIPWRSAYVSKMFDKIDVFNNSKKSCQAKRQMKKRIVGSP